MKLVTGDLWSYFGKVGYCCCITTNGFVKTNGEAVMGRGCALQAKQRWPEVPALLGDLILRKGNIPHFLLVGPDEILTFPTKHVWWEKSDPTIIACSAGFLKGLADMYPEQTYILPKPGCSNGGLLWEQVEPLLTFLPDNVWVIDYA